MIPGPSRGREGAIELVVRSSGLTFTGERVVWLVTTNKGWLHLRGVGRLDGGPPAPFRCDLFSSAMVRADGPDLMVLRIYDAQADPNHDGPVAKLRAALGAGSVQLGPGFRSTSGAERSGRP